ncbi:MAG: Fic family protein, partial [Acetobacteraceae bacterium]
MSDAGARYERITALAEDFTTPEADAVEALGALWRERLTELRESRALAAFNEQLYRRWAIETGIIERLYAIDRGVTRLLVERGLDIALMAHGSTDRPPEEILPVLRDHRDAVDYVMDFVAGEHDLSVHFIRSLHQRLTAHQDMVEAVDPFGRAVSVPLLHGDWKQQPNNPIRNDGTAHTYCPPMLVAEEMDRLIALCQAMEARKCPAAVVSAWLHHRFAQIHPFQDGNGRVARALAAFVFIRRGLFPIVIDRDDRGEYIACLERADRGDIAPLVALWCRLQTREITEALSLSETMETATGTPGAARTHLLAAIAEQARQRRQTVPARREAMLAAAERVFDDSVLPAL